MQVRSLAIFESAIKSDASRKTYRYHLRKFLEFAKVPDTDTLLQLKDDDLQELVEDYLLYQRHRVSPNTIPSTFSPIELFFIMNGRRLDFKRIHKMYPARTKKTGYNAWSTEDVKKILQAVHTKRAVALIHLLASSGCRIGTIPDLKLKHVSQMQQGCKAIIFYEGTNEEYTGFLTPEASKALDEYLEERRKDGENVSDESPVFRNMYQVGKSKVKPISLDSIEECVNRTVKMVDVRRKKIGKRYDIQANHAFRKRYNTILKLNGNINSNIAEKLLGHKNGLDGVYFTPNKDALFNEFVKAIPELTISDEMRQEIKIEKLEKEKSELERMKEGAQNAEKEHKINETKIKTLEETAVQLTERLQRNESRTAELQLIYSKINETLNRESDPYNPDFPDGGPFDTRLINLKVSEINDKSMVVFDTEFEEDIDVVLKEDKIYCKRDRSSNCKHVLFALGNPEFYQLVKRNNIGLPFLTVSSRTKKI